MVGNFNIDTSCTTLVSRGEIFFGATSANDDIGSIWQKNYIDNC